MNTDTKQNINANIHVRTNTDTSVNNHTNLHFHAGIKSTRILMGLLHTNNDINIHSNASNATIHIFATICFEDRNLILFITCGTSTENIINMHTKISYDYYYYSYKNWFHY